MVLRPLSPETNAGSGESVWITVHVVGRQPFASRAPVLLLLFITSTRTVPTKVVAIAVFAAFNAIMSRLTVLPAILVLITPVMAPAAVEVSYALKPPGSEGGTGRSARMWALPTSASLAAVAVLAPVAVPPA